MRSPGGNMRALLNGAGGHWRRAAAVALLTALLAGCGGAGDEDANGNGAEPEPAPDWWRCSEPRLDGRFVFGRAPFGCPVSEFGDPETVTHRYSALIFDDTAARDAERQRYMGEMRAFLGTIAEQVIVDRKPGVDDSEIGEWQRAVFAAAHQESFWAHYREDPSPETPTFLSMLRGDGGHGHGLLQLDDRFWRDALRDGAGWRLEEHALFTLNILFDGWERAPEQPCVSRADSWRERSRAAYSAYNGGPGSICRWTNPDDPVHTIDVQFADKYDRREWRDFVSEPTAASSLDLACLRAGAQGCEVAEPQGAGRRTLLRTSEGAVCVRRGDGHECLDSLADAACLTAHAGMAGAPIATAQEGDDRKQRILDRHTVCDDAVGALAGVGDTIELRRDAGLAPSPDAAPVAEARAGERLQVLDYRVTDARSGARHYRVARAGERYWLAGGDHGDHATHAVAVAAPADPAGPVPVVGARWWVARDGGITLRAEPDGDAVGHVPDGTAVTVREIAVRDADNRVFVRVAHGGEMGWLYAGRAGPPETFGDWLSPQAEGESP